MTVLLIVNDSPYGNEKTYNAIRTAMALQRQDPPCQILMFLMADAVGTAMAGQNTPQGYYNLETMLKAVIAKGGQVKMCGTCLDARGLKDQPQVAGATVGSMPELAEWICQADKVLTF